MIDAGRLRHRVTIQYPADARDSFGAPEIDWETFAVVWAAIEPLSAREFVSAQAEQSKVVGRITIRKLAGIDADMRIEHNGEIYNIEGILTDKDSGLEYITIPVSKGVRYQDE